MDIEQQRDIKRHMTKIPTKTKLYRTKLRQEQKNKEERSDGAGERRSRWPGAK